MQRIKELEDAQDKAAVVEEAALSTDRIDGVSGWRDTVEQQQPDVTMTTLQNPPSLSPLPTPPPQDSAPLAPNAVSRPPSPSPMPAPSPPAPTVLLPNQPMMELEAAQAPMAFNAPVAQSLVPPSAAAVQELMAPSATLLPKFEQHEAPLPADLQNKEQRDNTELDGDSDGDHDSSDDSKDDSTDSTDSSDETGSYHSEDMVQDQLLGSRRPSKSPSLLAAKVEGEGEQEEEEEEEGIVDEDGDDDHDAQLGMFGSDDEVEEGEVIVEDRAPTPLPEAPMSRKRFRSKDDEGDAENERGLPYALSNGVTVGAPSSAPGVFQARYSSAQLPQSTTPTAVFTTASSNPASVSASLGSVAPPLHPVLSSLDPDARLVASTSYAHLPPFDDSPHSLATHLNAPSSLPIAVSRPPPLIKSSYTRRPAPASLRVDHEVSTLPTSTDDSPLPSPAQLPTQAPSSHLPPPPKGAYVRPDQPAEAGVASRASSVAGVVRGDYQRPLVPKPPAPPAKPEGALPLSAREKAVNLPVQLAKVFCDELTLDTASNPKIFAPPARSVPFVKPASLPTEGVLYGFWPAPPSLRSGKAQYPAPAPDPSALDPEDDIRPRVDIFVDNSNIIYSFLNWARLRPESKMQNYQSGQADNGNAKVIKTVMLGGRKVRMDYDVLFAILERGRKVEKRVLSYEISVLQRVARPVVPKKGVVIKPPPPPQPQPPAPTPLQPMYHYQPHLVSHQQYPQHSAQYPQYPQHLPPPQSQSLHFAAPQPVLPIEPVTGPLSTAPVGKKKMTRGGRGSKKHKKLREQLGLAPGAQLPAQYVPVVPHNPPPPSPMPSYPPPPPLPVQKKESKQYKEQGVDELLHLKILESLLDYTVDPNGPAPILVLATGDANNSEYNPQGFLGVVRRALERGWDVEIVAFPMGTSVTWLGEEAKRVLTSGAMAQKGKLRVINLGLFAEELVL